MQLRRIGADGGVRIVERAIAAETPIAMEYNGIGYAVLMATPADLDDLAVGFANAERLIDGIDDVLDVESHETPGGILLRVTLADHCVARLHDRVRHRVSDSACGLCGIENLEQALRPLPRLEPSTVASDAAVFRSLSLLEAKQSLNRDTGTAHAAAACSIGGDVLLVREDVGRHNAFDKLIGALMRARQPWQGGFALLSSRCSYELVEKAALSACPMLVTISAPTALAIERAEAAGLALRFLARPDALLRTAET